MLFRGYIDESYNEHIFTLSCSSRLENSGTNLREDGSWFLMLGTAS